MSGGARLRVAEVRPLAPGPGLPGDLAVDRSNNNLDLIRHDGALWLAWRTAPTHFADAAARLEVVRSVDGGTTWRHERTVAMGRDVREPRFYVAQGRLHLTWFSAGTSRRAFQPDRVWCSVREPAGWSDPLAVGPPDTVVWRVRPVAGSLHMSVYRHASTLFTATPRPLEVELWRSEDGLTWSPAAPAPLNVGGSETELLDLGDGRVLYVIRKEGPDGGWGADLAVADAADPATLVRQRAVPQKLDSPLLVPVDGRVLLVTRRQVAFGGRYDLGWRVGGPVLRTRAYQGLYWLTPKRTAVYEVDPDELTLHHLGDLPSNGDTAFAAALPGTLDDPDAGPGTITVANYSSRRDRGWWPWVLGQLRPTHLYTCRLDVTAAPDRS